MAMTQKIRFAHTLSFMPLIILFFFITPLAILLNPEVIPRFLGKTSEISQYGYLDLEHYLDIAENYDKEAWRTAFYPLWPKCLNLFNHFSPFDKYRTAIFVSSFLGIPQIFHVATFNSKGSSKGRQRFLEFLFKIGSPW